MRRKLYAVAAISILSVCLYLVFISLPLKQSSQPNELSQSTRLITEPEADDPHGAILYEIEKTKDPSIGRVPYERLELARKIQLQKFALQERTGQRGPVSGLNWTERGPDSVAGRTRAILYDRNDLTFRKVWAGGVGGGLWYTNDITAPNVSWNKISDTFNNLAVTAIAQKDNIMVFGTGEGWSNIDAIRGNGIWRSLNGGVTWEHLDFTKNNPDFYYINDLVFLTPVSGGCAPGNLRILATTKTAGVQISLDTGKTWSKTLGAGAGGGNINAGADLEQEYYYVWATLGLFGQPGGGIYRSCDGLNWDKIYQATSDEERIDISVHYQLAFYMYALVQNLVGTDTRGIKRIMKTDGAYPPPFPPTMPTFTDLNFPSWCDDGPINNVDFTRGQAWYDLIVAVTPIFNNHDNAFIGGVDIHKTSNSGGMWTQVSQWNTGCIGKPFVHADIHNIIFRPDAMGGYLFNDMLVATDGGIFRSTDGGNTFTARNKTYNVTQFYGCALHPTNMNYILAGSQDNGTRKFTTMGLNNTTNIYPSDHDGGFCYIDEDNPNIQITSYLYNNYFISTNGGGSFTYRSRNNRGRFINPTDYDDGGDILYCGDANGQYYRWKNLTVGNDTAVVTVSTFNNAHITSVAVSPSVANRVYFGLNNGSIVQVDDADAGTSKTGVVIRPDLGNDYIVSCIAIDPTDETHMLVTYSNYGVTSVYESSPGTGGSLDWNSVEGDLPDMPVRWAMFDPRNNNRAILATEMGVWSTNDLNASSDWEPTYNSFAHTRVDHLQYHDSFRILAAATHGRGLFTTPIPAAAVPVTLTDFHGKLQGNNIVLHWKTVTEQNNKGFEIERSVDGSNFTTIGFIAGAGNSNSIIQYSFPDKQIAQTYNYYRLKQIDLDEKFEYSRTILIKYPLVERTVLLLLNNPFKNELDLQFGNISKGRAEIRMLDIGGRTVFQWSGLLQPNSRLRIQVPKQPSGGLYVVQLLLNGQQYAVLARKE